MQTAAAQFRIRIERPKAMTSPQERELLRATVEHVPSHEMKRRRAGAPMITDDFAEAILLLENCIASGSDFGVCNSLAHALLARENELDTRRADVAAAKAVEPAPESALCAAAFAVLAKAQIRLSDNYGTKNRE